ncbi:mannose-6-phosphate isomerase, class I [Rhodococcus sp. IEGM 1379]|uniref:mannose-6-phosphate isomerase, class I n=1 Tax=Rhodococcus sp. IEGM 1379 TaxID=3047086 RepID=UPI0024B7319F|nr:mannose-6-phosphate isomerase, class I [Rhodococcus sp. IEGM 1379]MDI9915067.1 mannose-6-phosphate isomerase, class I [Rhodococcus sp. IEGM 1379]
MELIAGVIKSYDWGSRTTLAELTGRTAPSSTTEAEMWFGAHESAPSPLPESSGPATLVERIGTDPLASLGSQCRDAFGGRLPFLLKVLAVQRSLSLQAHPTEVQARAGYAGENRGGIPLDAAHRNYRDDRHKPELVVALEQFEALAGFRDVPATVDLLTAIDVPELAEDVALLAASPTPGKLKCVATRWLGLSSEYHTQVDDTVLKRTTALLASGGSVVDRFRAELSTASELARDYRGDRGVLMSLLLNRVTLAPGEGLYLPAGNLHAYLSGTAVEIMANSDNVLRGGLTTKHIDVAELSAILDFDPISVEVLRPHSSGVEYRYSTPAREFMLTRWELDHSTAYVVDNSGPSIVLCMSGDATIRHAGTTRSLHTGEALWVPAGETDLSFEADGPRAQLFVASVGKVSSELAA